MSIGATMNWMPYLQLGQASALPQSPEEARLDRVPNPHAGTDYLARFTCPEFHPIAWSLASPISAFW